MPDFLVHIRTRVPTDLAPTLWADVIAAERVRGAELRRSGAIRHIWRVSSGTSDIVMNVGIWRAADEGSLTRAIDSLPARPWMEIQVTHLADHPLTDVPCDP